jgi:murein DD-endopeptidase MepM/ murein hydrolase activator NlpD
VPPLAALQLGLFVTLRARPGPLAIVLWKWGLPLLLAANALLLVAALVSALWGRQTVSWRRAAGLAGLSVLVATATTYRIYPSSHDNAPSQADFRLPLDGPVTVAWGGSTPVVNYHVSAPAERWAYDLLITIDGMSHRGDGAQLTDYYAYDRPISAPAAGRVVAVHDGDPDEPPGRPAAKRGGGNRIVLEVARDQYLTLAHLKAGTIRVAPGQRVRQGDSLGRVGNSGNSSEPHLHLHLQDTPVPGSGEGIPFYFSRYVRLDTGAMVSQGMPQGGLRRRRWIGHVVSSVAPFKS